MSQNPFHSPSRRQFIAGGAALGTLPLLPKGAYAADPYHFSHGAFEIAVLSDGFIMLPAEIILPDTVPDERPGILKRPGGTADSAPFQVNIPLIRTGDDLILVDAGSGDKFQASAGKLAANLRAAGIDPASVTKVVFTHAHPDHSGGTILPDGKLLYPNADYFVGDAEWRFWTDSNYERTMPAALHEFARGAQRDLFAVRDRLTQVKLGDEIVPGMRVVDTRGHTPGRLVRAGGQRCSHRHWRRCDQQCRLLRASELALRLRHRTGHRAQEQGVHRPCRDREDQAAGLSLGLSGRRLCRAQGQCLPVRYRVRVTSRWLQAKRQDV